VGGVHAADSLRQCPDEGHSPVLPHFHVSEGGECPCRSGRRRPLQSDRSSRGAIPAKDAAAARAACQKNLEGCLTPGIQNQRPEETGILPPLTAPPPKKPTR